VAPDVIVSNCVVNLSVDNPAMFASMHRVLRAGGRVAISDVVADGHLTAAERAERGGGWVGCIAGPCRSANTGRAFSPPGLTGVTIDFTPRVATAFTRPSSAPSKPSADPRSCSASVDDLRRPAQPGRGEGSRPR